MVSFWAFSNRQMFENKIGAVVTYGEITYSHHLLSSKEWPAHTHSTLLLIGLIILALGTILFKVKLHFKDKATESKAAKRLPDFFKALSQADCEALIEDEEFFRREAGFKSLDDPALHKLK